MNESHADKMQIVVEVDQASFEKIAQSALTKLLEFNNYTYGDGTRLIVEKTKETLFSVIKDYDFEETIRGIFEVSFEKIARDVVTEEIRKIVRKTVKEMHGRGELLDGNETEISKMQI